MLVDIDNFHVKFVCVSMDAVGRRIDNFLLSYLKGISRNRVYRILRRGEVRVNKKRIKCVYRLNFGDIIRIPPMQGLKSKKENKEFPEVIIKKLHDSFLYEDDDIIILNKPSGIAVHGGSGLSFNIIDGLRIICSKFRFLELVHRLDRETSGALLLAKNYLTLIQLHEQLRLNMIKKEYLALVFGECEFHVNTVVAPLIKNFFSLRLQNIEVDLVSGKYSKTCFTVKERFMSSTLLNANPITGRTHQIRVHAQYIGHPIAFDRRYGNKFFNKKIKNSGLNRLFLHAFSLRFIHPRNKKVVYVEAPMDSILLNCLSFLRDN